jgi:transposase-like protein
MNITTINNIRDPQECSDGHDLVIFDSFYGRYSCPVCFALSQLVPEEERETFAITIKTLEKRIKDYIERIEELESVRVIK